ncbi:MAG: hypothetical protein KAH84_05200 [Thiomargarita sp.]|nr:hypothetical protein [Thiomargarita sp.]
MSSIIQVKAEVQKLIKQYNKLQTESKVAINTKEATRKALEANKLVSQISSLQLAITKQAKGKIDAKNPAGSQNVKTTASLPNANVRKSELEERMIQLEDTQRKNRSQIEQLNKAKAQLADLKNQTENDVLNVVKERDSYEEKLQQELANLVDKKEAEHLSIKQEIDNIREDAKKNAESLKMQRDSARSMMKKQQQTEKEHSMASIYQKSNKNIFIGVILGIVFSSILGGIIVLVFLL